MIIEETQTTFTGNMKFARVVPMQIDPKALAGVLDHLISQYTRPVEAVLRENVSNALDAHRDAGQTRPIEVSLPTEFSPNLVIQDWGVGMTATELEAYGQFGVTSKQDSNKKIGGYGYGSKAGLAIAASYNVVSVKDGKQNTAVIHRDAHGAPALAMLDEVDTDKPNGTTVTIPTSETYRLQQIANTMFIGQQRGTILIDGEEPRYSVSDEQTFRSLGTTGWMLTSEAALRLPTSDEKGLAAIAGVLIPLDWNEVDPNLHSRLKSGILRNVIVNLENGSVKLLRSREQLEYVPSTIAVVKAKLDEILAESRAEFQKQIDAAQTFRAAWRIRSQADSAGFTGDYTYKGVVMDFDPTPYANDDNAKALTKVSYDGEKIERIGMVITHDNTVHQIVTGSEHAVLVTNARNAEMARTYRYHYNSWNKAYHPESRTTGNFIKQYVDEATSTETTRNTKVYFTTLSPAQAELLFVGMFDKIIDVAEFDATKKRGAKAKATATRLARPVTVKDKNIVQVRELIYHSGGRSEWTDTSLDALDTTAEYILLKADGEATLAGRLFRAVTSVSGYREYQTYENNFAYYVIKPGKYKVLLALKSWDTSKYADQITLVTPEEAIQRVLDANAATADFTPEQLQAIADYREYNIGWASRMDEKSVENILDEELRTWVLNVTDAGLRERFGKYSDIAHIKNVFPGLTGDVIELPDSENTESPTAKYPMLDLLDSWGSRGHSEVIVDYLNTVHLFNL